MAKAAIIAAGVAGTIALGAAGYFANEWRVCRGLEQDVLETASTIRRSSDARFFAGTFGAELNDPAIGTAEDGIRMVFAKQLEHIYNRCGLPAGDEAKQKAEVVLFSA